MKATDKVSGILKNIFQGKFLISILFFLNFSVQVHAAEGDFLWVRSMGGSLDDIGHNVSLDATGNVYTTGYFNDTVDFDPGPGDTSLTSTGNADIFVSKLDSNGNFVWAKHLGGSFDDEGFGIFNDSAGNVYVTGYFQGSNIDFDPGAGIHTLTSEGSADIFICKLDSDGNFVNAWSLGGNTFDYGYDIFVDSSGNIYITGYFQNTLTFNPGSVNTGLTSAGGFDIFISKISNGSLAWAERIGGADADVGLGISLYAGGNIFLTGWFQGTGIDFDPGVGEELKSSSNGSYDIFVLKLSTSGAFVWARTIGGSSEDIGQAVAVDGFGNVFTTGWFNGTVDFDPGTGVANLINPGIGSDIFVNKLDSSGNFVWARAMGGSSAADVGYGIAVDSKGSVYTTGSFQGTDVDFDPGVGTFPLSSTGNEDIFISKLDSSGNFVWAKSMGGVLDDYGYDIFVDALGTVYTTGYFRDTVDFDSGPGSFSLASTGTGIVPFPAEDIFIHKLAGRNPFSWNLFLPAITGNKQP